MIFFFAVIAVESGYKNTKFRESSARVGMFCIPRNVLRNTILGRLNICSTHNLLLILFHLHRIITISAFEVHVYYRAVIIFDHIRKFSTRLSLISNSDGKHCIYYDVKIGNRISSHSRVVFIHCTPTQQSFIRKI